MVEISKQYLSKELKETGVALQEMRWYFTLESHNFLQLCNCFFEGIKAKDNDFQKILKHFTKIDFQFMKLFQEWTKCLYLTHLPLAVFRNIFYIISFIF